MDSPDHHEPHTLEPEPTPAAGQLESARLAAIGSVAGAVAHEINNPLQVIVGAAELLERDAAAGGSRESKELIERIYDAVGRCSRVVRALLTFSSTDEPVSERLDLSAVVDLTHSLVRATVARRGLALDVRLGVEVMVQGSRAHLSQALTYLVFNACDASERGGRIQIEVERRGKAARIVVRDFGHGMAPEVRARIFEPFFTTKEADRGLGLGLPMVWGIVRQHGGTVEVESVEGEGSVFVVTLPLAD